MPIVIYPFCSCGLLIWAAFDNVAAGAAVSACSVVFPVVIGGIAALRSHVRAKTMRARLCRELALVPDDELLASDVEASPLLRQTFELFDQDSSGAIDATEMRELLHAMYPRLTRDARRQMVAVSSAYPTVELDSFDDIILAWRAFAAKHDPRGRWTRPATASSLSSSRGMQISAFQLTSTTSSTVGRRAGVVSVVGRNGRRDPDAGEANGANASSDGGDADADADAGDAGGI